ncbi:hypothetical protein F8388_008164 [Cannabis sativa]|uniref:CTP synthase (glutamine hydrolyzing) n=1 Tax=Cannabis sativa TaxID=3483 RepID=A0A7J6EX65_CANSA|nr:hypothetical protein F8388_008164 [Cannabis sativa]KAF4391291.1 hypothetical protein G4B88_016601 [Cannabis sativa]
MECFIIGIVDGKIIFHRLLLSSASLCPTNQQIIDVSTSDQRSLTQTARRTKASSHFPSLSLSLVSPSSPFDQGQIAIFSKTQHLKMLDLFRKEGPGNFCLIHVSLVPVLNVVGEKKTKPTQHNVRGLRCLGLTTPPHLSKHNDFSLFPCLYSFALALDENVKMKLSQFCHVPKDNIIILYDVSHIWHIPLLLSDQKAHEAIFQGSKTHMGGTMRVGSRRTYFQVMDCKSSKLYGNKSYIDERHPHRYEVNPELVRCLEKGGLCFTGKDITDPRRRDREFPRHSIVSSRMRSNASSLNPDISHREGFSAAAKNWAHFPHIHFGLMPDQTGKKTNVCQQE